MDDKQAFKYFGKACDLHSADGCLRLGFFYEIGAAMRHPDIEKAAALYRTACDAGKANACYSLATLLHTGRGVPKNDNEAFGFFQKACQSHFEAACDAIR